MSEFFDTNPNKAICFSFWFQMYGASVGSLRVYFIDDATRKVLWEMKGKQNDDQVTWFEAMIPITKIEDSYTMLVEGVADSPLGASYIA